MLFFQNRKLRKRPGNIPVRVLRPGKKRWTSAHGLWVSDVFAWRGSPAAWNEDLLRVSGVSIHSADEQEREKLKRIGDDPVVASFALEDATLKVAAPGARTDQLSPDPSRDHWRDLPDWGSRRVVPDVAAPQTHRPLATFATARLNAERRCAHCTRTEGERRPSADRPRLHSYCLSPGESEHGTRSLPMARTRRGRAARAGDAYDGDRRPTLHVRSGDEARARAV